MSLLKWTLRGLFSPMRQKEVQDLIREKKIDLFGLPETNFKRKKEDLKRKWEDEWICITNKDNEPREKEQDGIWIG